MWGYGGRDAGSTINRVDANVESRPEQTRRWAWECCGPFGLSGVRCPVSGVAKIENFCGVLATYLGRAH